MGSKSSKVIKTKQRSINDNNTPTPIDHDQQQPQQQYSLSTIYSDPCHLFSASKKSFLDVEFLKKLERVEIKEFIGGSQHLFVWLEDDPLTSSSNFTIDSDKFIVNVKHNLYGLMENDYGQCSELQSNTNKVILNLKDDDFIAMIKKDKEILKKASKQVWTLKGVNTVCNYTFFHIITRGEYNFELVLGTGWNNAGCCSVGDASSNIRNAKPVIFDIGGNHTVFLPEGQEITMICSGGCNSIIVSKDVHTNQQFVYGAGEAMHHVNDDQANTSHFTIIKQISQDIGTERFIKKTLSGYGSTHFLLSDGTLFSYGRYPLSSSGLHTIDSSMLRGETISDFACYEDLFAILTREGNVWVASATRTLTVSEFEPGTIVQMIPSLRFNAIALRTREDDIMLISDRDFENSKTLNEKLLQHLTLDSFITQMDLTGNKEDENKLRTLARLTQCQEYSISIHCLHNFILAFTPNQKKNAAKKRMLEKLKEQLLTSTNPFQDVTFN